MFAPLQMGSLLSLPLPPSAVQPVELPSLLPLCPPRRGSEFMLPSRFHPRFGDLPNANANALLPPRLETCRRYPNLRFLLCGPRPELQLRPAGLQMNLITLIDASCHQYCGRGSCHLTFFPRAYVTIPLSPIGPKDDLSFGCTYLFSFSPPILAPVPGPLVQSAAYFLH